MNPSNYYAVIFTSEKAEFTEGYDEMAKAMEELAMKQPGFIGFDSIRGADGKGITVSYWKTEQHIQDWKENAAHKVAQEKGRRQWYANYSVRVCKVEREYP